MVDNNMPVRVEGSVQMINNKMTLVLGDGIKGDDEISRKVSSLTTIISEITTSNGDSKRTTSGPCSFTKAVAVTDELNTFLGNPMGTELSRSDVTKGVMKYARAHDLMAKKIIKADNTLRKLLTLNEDQELTILNLQKFLKRHYI